MTAMMVRCLLALALASGLAASSAVAQDYPSRPVKILVGFGPGGLGDIVTRVVAIAEPDMGKRLAELGLVPKTSTPQELQAVYEADVERWRGVIERANLKIEQ
jgi:tripartite-type tricarboxylate transporter receptor subunit TctC